MGIRKDGIEFRRCQKLTLIGVDNNSSFPSVLCCIEGFIGFSEERLQGFSIFGKEGNACTVFNLEFFVFNLERRRRYFLQNLHPKIPSLFLGQFRYNEYELITRITDHNPFVLDIF